MEASSPASPSPHPCRGPREFQSEDGMTARRAVVLRRASHRPTATPGAKRVDALLGAPDSASACNRRQNAAPFIFPDARLFLRRPGANQTWRLNRAISTQAAACLGGARRRRAVPGLQRPASRRWRRQGVLGRSRITDVNKSRTCSRYISTYVHSTLVCVSSFSAPDTGEDLGDGSRNNTGVASLTSHRVRLPTARGAVGHDAAVKTSQSLLHHIARDAVVGRLLRAVVV